MIRLDVDHLAGVFLLVGAHEAAEQRQREALVAAAVGIEGGKRWLLGRRNVGLRLGKGKGHACTCGVMRER